MNHVSLLTDNYERSSYHVRIWDPLGTLYAWTNIFPSEVIVERRNYNTEAGMIARITSK